MRRIGIAIAGASCSGKTTLAQVLTRHLDATLVRIDDYYRSMAHLSFEARCDVNFDHPDTIDSPLLIAQMRQLLSGESVDAPRYDFTRHCPFEVRERVEPKPVVIVEGLFALCYPELADLCEVKVFVDAPEAVCLDRRIARDVAERGRAPGEVIGRFHSHVAPMYRAHVLPSAERANVRVCGVQPEAGHEQILRDIAIYA